MKELVFEHRLGIEIQVPRAKFQRDSKAQISNPNPRRTHF
jgi:hypothetical protein